MNPTGARVVLSSPYGELKRGGEPLGPTLVIPNGSTGRVIVGDAGPMRGGTAAMVCFDELGEGVAVAVPQHWLASAPTV